MILENLTLTDFRVFKGRHTFDLTPRKKYSKSRPIILFGGLNGAGKTTILNGIRTALYGKQSLGTTTSQKSYDDFLRNCINHSDDTLIKSNSTKIELVFSHGKMGVVKKYTVVREWLDDGRKINETLKIKENDNILEELTVDQCQGFLNELIPIGVSNLFFFDGEKIAELAEDTSGHALGDAIKQLIGLDVIETLNADLTILLRNKVKENSTLATQKEINKLQEGLQECEEQENRHLEEFEHSLAELSEVNLNLVKSENVLASRGGAWAATREEEIKKHTNLLSKKDHIEREIRECIDSSYPFVLAEEFIHKTLKQLKNESLEKKRKTTAELLVKQVTEFEDNLKKRLDGNQLSVIQDEIKKSFHGHMYPRKRSTIIHDVSDSFLSKIEFILNDTTQNLLKQLEKLSSEYETVLNELDMAGKNISRAPEETTIQPLISEIKDLQEKKETLLVKQNTIIEARKYKLREAIDIARRLDKLTESTANTEQNFRTINFAKRSKLLLNEFSIEATKHKINDLENEFINSYQRLARKNDLNLRVEINPSNFSVKLFSDNDIEIDKNELSAGEKQIYAIAILEALAITSGRKLPMIIDTPLARLDSIHRKKIIQNYFPNASHQMIILSTDTEVDEEYYNILSSSISHAYYLNYDSHQKQTTASEGYFWKKKNTEAVQDAS